MEIGTRPDIRNVGEEKTETTEKLQHSKTSISFSENLSSSSALSGFLQ